MPNSYLYVVVALVIILVVVGAYLGIMVNNEAAKVSSLQGELNALRMNYTALHSQYLQLQSQYGLLQSNYSQLKANYTALKSQYSYLQDQYIALQAQYGQLKLNYTTLAFNYTTLQHQYSQLLSQYNMLKENYSGLMINYQALNQTYASIVSTISLYKSLIQPVAYMFPGSSMGNVAIFLNITNPTNEPMNITIGVYMGSPMANDLIFFPTIVLIPPKATIPLPVLLALFNSSTTYYSNYYYWIGWVYGGSSLSEFTHANLTIILVTKELASLGLSGFIYNTSITKVLSAHQPMGFATYYPSTAPWNSNIWMLFIANPLTSAILIKSYEIYSYNGTPLTMCSFNTALTVNATSVVTYNSLLPQTSLDYIGFNAATPSGSKFGLIPLSLNCTVNYRFPPVVQLPYGYVVLNTNIGNITVPLLPSNGWWQ